MSNKPKVAIYCRVGKEEKPKAAIYCRAASADDFAIKAQEETLRNFAAGQMLKVGGIYADNGANGLTLDRPAFRKMMSVVENGEIDCVIVRSISRISRDSIQFVNWLDDMRDRNVRVIAADDCYDSRDASGFFEKALHEYMEQMLKADISERIKQGIARSRQRKPAQTAKISV